MKSTLLLLVARVKASLYKKAQKERTFRVLASLNPLALDGSITFFFCFFSSCFCFSLSIVPHCNACYVLTKEKKRNEMNG